MKYEEDTKDIDEFVGKVLHYVGRSDEDVTPVNSKTYQYIKWLIVSDFFQSLTENFNVSSSKFKL